MGSWFGSSFFVLGSSGTISGMDDDTQQSRNRSGDDTTALSPDDIAQKLQIGIASVYRWIHAGHLKAIRVGPKLFRVLREDYAGRNPNLELY
jgi:excisionase family DNA binding protein